MSDGADGVRDPKECPVCERSVSAKTYESVGCPFCDYAPD